LLEETAVAVAGHEGVAERHDGRSIVGHALFFF
jgi:hypothetical protein